MTINLQKPDIKELKPKITVFGVGGGGGNAVNNMIHGGLEGVDFVVANTDAQALTMSAAEKVIQLGADVTEGLGAGSQPDIGRAAAEECIDEIADYLSGTHMAFVTAGMGGGTGTGAAPVVARAAREKGVLTVGVVTKPFQFEGQRRMETAEAGISELQKNVDTLIVIPNQNLFRIANDKTTFADAFGMADQVLYSGVACITDLMVKEGLINLDFADVRSVMREMGKAMMGTGEASGEGRAMQAAEAAISNPLLDESSMRGAQGLLISITGGRDLTLFEVDEAATRIREEVDQEANIILGATFDEALEGVIRVSVVATGIDNSAMAGKQPVGERKVEAISRSVQAAPLPAATPAPAEKVAAIAKSLETPQAAAPKVERDGVTLAPFKPEASLFADPAIEEEFKNALEEELMPSAEGFVPPAAEKPKTAPVTPAIPEVADFPAIARAELNANRTSAPAAAPEHDAHGPKGLLQKLKSGFSAREAEEEGFTGTAPAAAAEPASPAQPVPATPQSAGTAPAPATTKSAPMVRPATARVDDNPYAPRRGQLDPNGRINPADRAVQDDDQLDIPAFLRRQAN